MSLLPISFGSCARASTPVDHITADPPKGEFEAFELGATAAALSPRVMAASPALSAATTGERSASASSAEPILSPRMQDSPALPAMDPSTLTEDNILPSIDTYIQYRMFDAQREAFDKRLTQLFVTATKGFRSLVRGWMLPADDLPILKSVLSQGLPSTLSQSNILFAIQECARRKQLLPPRLRQYDKQLTELYTRGTTAFRAEVDLFHRQSSRFWPMLSNIIPLHSLFLYAPNSFLSAVSCLNGRTIFPAISEIMRLPGTLDHPLQICESRLIALIISENDAFRTRALEFVNQDHSRWHIARTVLRLDHPTVWDETNILSAIGFFQQFNLLQVRHMQIYDTRLAELYVTGEEPFRYAVRQFVAGTPGQWPATESLLHAPNPSSLDHSQILDTICLLIMQPLSPSILHHYDQRLFNLYLTGTEAFRNGAKQLVGQNPHAFPQTRPLFSQSLNRETILPAIEDLLKDPVLFPLLPDYDKKLAELYSQSSYEFRYQAQRFLMRQPDNSWPYTEEAIRARCKAPAEPSYFPFFQTHIDLVNADQELPDKSRFLRQKP